ncbi:MAG: RNase adapter RapZ [Gemmatimonadota bacterium]|nr:RNase adapter RapZ [Gemmatimonadota bacterium]
MSGKSEMGANNPDGIRAIYERWSGKTPERIVPLSAHGSSRKYYRITDDGNTVIGVNNDDRKENIAFLTFSRHFNNHGLPVPEIYEVDLENGLFLQQDLGDDTLYTKLTAFTNKEGFSDRLTDIYRRVLDYLPGFQITAGADLDYSVCYPRDRFDEQSIRWDLNYFKYYFLKFTDIAFDEQALEDDFGRFTAYLMQADHDYFMYRDLQSRNIMWHQDQPWFIDYQGGRRGALQYDIASLLQDAKAEIPWHVRDELLEYYIESASRFIPIDRENFMQYYFGYALIRIMQAFGAYGLRGLHEGKSHFLRSISFAVHNLGGLLERTRLPIDIPALSTAWRQITASDHLKQMGLASLEGLAVHIRSFSFHHGIPQDTSGHGGGFVFDCRILPNPGRLSEFAHMTGKDSSVIAFLQQRAPVETFTDEVIHIIDQAINHHLQRGFSDLSINFGCTGGQHRSVFLAEKAKKYIGERFKNVKVDLTHRELERGDY